jgi:hypothetical protein
MSSAINNKITEEVMPSLQGVIPSSMATCSLQGIPNNTAVSQVFYVDETHVAISHQFFNKTIRNINENPFACLVVTCPINYKLRKLLLRFVESKTTGEIFDNMKLQLDVIASMQHKEGVFVLQSADIYEVISLEVLE